MEHNQDPRVISINVEIFDELMVLANLGIGYLGERHGFDEREEEEDMDRIKKHIRRFNPKTSSNYQSSANEKMAKGKVYKDFLRANLNKTVHYDSRIFRYSGRLIGMERPGMYTVVQEPQKVKVTVEHSQMHGQRIKAPNCDYE